MRHTCNTARPAYGAAGPTHSCPGSWKSDTASLTADWVGNVDVGLSEPLAVMAGVLGRHETWRTGDLGDVAGDAGGPPAGRTVGSLYPGTPPASDTSRIPASGSSTSAIKPQDATDITRNAPGACPGEDDRASLAVDAYRLKVKDVIIATATLQGPTVTAAFDTAGRAGFTQASSYANGWNSRTDGVDVIGLGGGERRPRPDVRARELRRYLGRLQAVQALEAGREHPERVQPLPG